MLIVSLSTLFRISNALILIEKVDHVQFLTDFITFDVETAIDIEFEHRAPVN